MEISDNLLLNLLYNFLESINERGGQALWREHLEFPASETMAPKAGSTGFEPGCLPTPLLNLFQSNLYDKTLRQIEVYSSTITQPSSAEASRIRVSPTLVSRVLKSLFSK